MRNKFEISNLRNPKLLKLFRFRSIWILFGVVVFVLSIWPAEPAKADPHAVFYTTTGQQQLFFNVLAALDQADYVETAFTRSLLQERREEAETEPPFEREDVEIVRESEVDPFQDADPDTQTPSQPGTPAILNRAVTLEGADLYTDQLVRLFGAEHARRNSLAELLQVFCEFGLGVPRCEHDVEGLQGEERQQAIAALEAARLQALLTDLGGWNSRPVSNGLFAALNSGNRFHTIPNPDPSRCVWHDPTNPFQHPADNSLLSDEEYRRCKYANPDVDSFPLAYSPTIAAWRNFIHANYAGTPLIDELNRLDDTLLEIVAEATGLDAPSYYPGSEVILGLNGQVAGYRCVTTDNNNNLVLDSSLAGCNWIPPEMEVSDYMEIANAEAETIKAEALREGESAMQRIRLQQEFMEQDGLLPQVALLSSIFGSTLNVPPGGPPPGQSVGELSALITSPVEARKGVIHSIPNVLGMLDASQQASSLAGLDTPGDKQLVYRPPAPECRDGIDNDGDAGISAGGIDYAVPDDAPPGTQPDPGCACPDDEDEGDFTTDPPPECGQVQGTQDSRAGRVLQAQSGSGAEPNTLNLFNPSAYPLFDDRKEPTSPSANLIQPHLEQGAVHALRVLTGGTFRSDGNQVTCGMTC